MFPIILQENYTNIHSFIFVQGVVSSWDVNYHKVWCFRTEHLKCNILPTLHECSESTWSSAWQNVFVSLTSQVSTWDFSSVPRHSPSSLLPHSYRKTQKIILILFPLESWYREQKIPVATDLLCLLAQISDGEAEVSREEKKKKKGKYTNTAHM